jgi:hypothetical protein
LLLLPASASASAGALGEASMMVGRPLYGTNAARLPLPLLLLELLLLLLLQGGARAG